jgi:serine/threonine-protein kinase
VLGVLGRGGMGVVYKARNLRLKRLVAVKMILAGEHAGPEHMARFRTEAEAIARLQHPNIVQVFEVGEQGEMPFLSLEFCGGGSLATKLRETLLPPAEAAALMQKLARAMQAAHDKEIIHRDLKPGNVLLADDGTPKITDFGLAKKLDEAGLTIPGVVVGTPSYMAPEQAEGWRDVGPLADVYALGAVLYECLTGRPPFKAATSLDTMVQVVSEEPVPPRRLNPAVPRDLETICLKCLRKAPGKRYASAQALADDLDRFLTHKPIQARPATTRERFAKWCRRNPLLAGLIVALVAYAVTFTWLSVSLRKQTQIAEWNEKEAKNQTQVAEKQTRIAKANEKVAKANEMAAKTEKKKAIGHVLGVARTLLARQLQQPPVPGGPAPEAIRGEILGVVREHLIKMAREINLSPFNEETIFGPFNQVAVHQQTGDFARDIGLLRLALAEYQQGYNLVKKITQEQPEDDKARANMAVMLLRLGNITWAMSGNKDMARTCFGKARDLRQEIADHPRRGEYTALNNRLGLAYIAIDRGRLEFSQGNLTAARQQLDQALEARRAWVKDPPAGEEVMAASYLSEACMWLGLVLAHQGDQEGAQKLLQEALELSARAVKIDPKDLSFQVDLADIHGARGDVQALRGDWGAASASYGKAWEHVLAANLTKTPEDAAGQVLLARTHERLAAVAEKKGDAQDARGQREMSLQIREMLTLIEPACVSWKAAWLIALAHMDRHAEAQAAAAELTQHAAGNAELLVQLARYHAIRAGKTASPEHRRAAAGRALALLGDAVKAGHADRFTLAGDPDLAPLRQEPGYQALLDRLAR